MGQNEFPESTFRPQGPLLRHSWRNGPPGSILEPPGLHFGVSKVMKNHPEMVSEAPKDDQAK